MPVNIHGKQYVTVAERITSAGTRLLGVKTEVLSHDPVVIKATVSIMKNPTGNVEEIFKYSGISAANPSKAMEKESPYEVAETSAVGRALAFAGFETTLGIASAEEVAKTFTRQTSSGRTETVTPRVNGESISSPIESLGLCPKCGAKNARSKSTGNIYCSDMCWKNQEKQTLTQSGLETKDIPF